MDGNSAALNDRPDPAAASQGSSLPMAAEPYGEPAGQPSTRGREGTPLLALDGFDGPLAQLLALARAQQLDLGRLSLTVLLEQLEAALRQAPATMPLGQKGDWVVMAAWLLQLRSRLLLPTDAPAQSDAAAEADQLRDHLVALQDMQALAVWLERRIAVFAGCTMAWSTLGIGSHLGAKTHLGFYCG